MWLTVLIMFWVASVAFLWQHVKAFDTAAIYDDGGTKAANDGSLVSRISHSLLGKSGMATRATSASFLLQEECPQMYRQYKWLLVIHHQYSLYIKVSTIIQPLYLD